MRESVAKVSDASLPTTSTESSSASSPSTCSIGSMNGSLLESDKGAIYRRKQQHGGVLSRCSDVLRRIHDSRADSDSLAQLGLTLFTHMFRGEGSCKVLVRAQYGYDQGYEYGYEETTKSPFKSTR